MRDPAGGAKPNAQKERPRFLRAFRIYGWTSGTLLQSAPQRAFPRPSSVPRWTHYWRVICTFTMGKISRLSFWKIVPVMAFSSTSKGMLISFTVSVSSGKMLRVSLPAMTKSEKRSSVFPTMPLFRAHPSNFALPIQPSTDRSSRIVTTMVTGDLTDRKGTALVRTATSRVADHVPTSLLGIPPVTARQEKQRATYREEQQEYLPGGKCGSMCLNRLPGRSIRCVWLRLLPFCLPGIGQNLCPLQLSLRQILAELFAAFGHSLLWSGFSAPSAAAAKRAYASTRFFVTPFPCS